MVDGHLAEVGPPVLAGPVGYSQNSLCMFRSKLRQDPADHAKGGVYPVQLPLPPLGESIPCLCAGIQVPAVVPLALGIVRRGEPIHCGGAPPSHSFVEDFRV